MAAIVQTEKVSRVYRVGGRPVVALHQVDLRIEPGTLVAFRGRSGSGKTTLLNCIGGLDKPTEGQIWVNGQEISRLSELARVRLRRQQIGFIFQSHALLPTYSAWENIDLMLRLAGMKRQERRPRIEQLLHLVGLGKWMDHRPHEMSGGQQQRVAIARAIATRPALILADEPTGELDSQTGQQIWQLFRQLVSQEKVTILIATHDLAVDAYADKLYILQDGRIIN
ncbi:MAG: ABC transporter ATP-binding protein [Anaerolineae bacterium]|nr:ABC transporter ATP-binding protein [Anaerolineae bacterium]